MSTDSRNSREAVQGNTDRKRWSRPELIHSKVARKTQKFESGIGYEYHETDGGGGGTTQLS
jgi:hypothetical protein